MSRKFKFENRDSIIIIGILFVLSIVLIIYGLTQNNKENSNLSAKDKNSFSDSQLQNSSSLEDYFRSSNEDNTVLKKNLRGSEESDVCVFNGQEVKSGISSSGVVCVP